MSTALEWTPPAGWHLLAPGEDVGTWIGQVVSQATGPVENALRLRHDLERLVPDRPTRHTIAAVSPDPETASRVIAAGWLQFGPAIDVRELSDALRSAQFPPNVLNRAVEVRESRRRPAVVCRDLIAGAGDTTHLLHERCAVVVVHNALEISVRIELSTSDLNAFTDIGSTCLAAADAFIGTNPGSPT